MITAVLLQLDLELENLWQRRNSLSFFPALRPAVFVTEYSNLFATCLEYISLLQLKFSEDYFYLRIKNQFREQLSHCLLYFFFFFFLNLLYSDDIRCRCNE